MPNYFSGPSTPQMRLTMLLIGMAALVAGIYSSSHSIKATAVAPFGNIVTADCGSAFDQRPATSFFPALARSCASEIGIWPFASAALYAVAAVFLIRFLYMLIGPKVQPA